MLQSDFRRIPEFIARYNSHKKDRGMSLMVDIRDWLGGWPMEFTADSDVIEFCESRSLSLTNILTGKACTEFVFKKLE